jgi:hypothetical protein
MGADFVPTELCAGLEHRQSMRIPARSIKPVRPVG